MTRNLWETAVQKIDISASVPKEGRVGWTAFLFALVSGAAITVQAGSNSQLKKSLHDPIGALAVNYVLGLVSVVLVPLAMRVPIPPADKISAVPWWAWIGGVLGILYGLPVVFLARAAIEMSKSEKFRQQIWTKAVAATTLPNSHSDAGKLLLPALNSMFDISTTRTMALQAHPPKSIYGLLFVLGLLCSLLVGYRMATSQHRSWLHILSFVVHHGHRRFCHPRC